MALCRMLSAMQDDLDYVELLRALCKKEITPEEVTDLLVIPAGHKTLTRILLAIQEDGWCAGHVLYPRRCSDPPLGEDKEK